MVMCFNSRPVDLSTFCSLDGKLYMGLCKETHCNVYIKRVGDDYFHVSDEYRDELIWYKTIKSDGGLMGVDVHREFLFEKVEN